MSEHLLQWANKTSVELDRVIYLIFAIVLLVVIASYLIFLFYLFVTHNRTCSIREGLNRAEHSKNKQQLLAELKNKIVMNQLQRTK